MEVKVASQFVTNRSSPHDAIKYDQWKLDPLQSHQGTIILDHSIVRIKMRYAPINPSDINVLEGTYMLQAQLPHVFSIF